MKSTTASLLAVQDCVAISFKWSYFRYTPTHWLVFVMELKYAWVGWYVGIVLCQLPQILVLTSSTREEKTLVVKTVFSPDWLRFTQVQSKLPQTEQLHQVLSGIVAFLISDVSFGSPMECVGFTCTHLYPHTLTTHTSYTYTPPIAHTTISNLTTPSTVRCARGPFTSLKPTQSPPLPPSPLALLLPLQGSLSQTAFWKCSQTPRRASKVRARSVWGRERK